MGEEPLPEQKPHAILSLVSIYCSKQHLCSGPFFEVLDYIWPLTSKLYDCTLRLQSTLQSTAGPQYEPFCITWFKSIQTNKCYVLRC